MSAGQLWRGVLTPSEAEVAELVSKGWSNPKIASEFVVEESTVKFHVHNAMAKFGFRSRYQLARWWWENVETTPQIPLGWEGSD